MLNNQYNNSFDNPSFLTHPNKFLICKYRKKLHDEKYNKHKITRKRDNKLLKRYKNHIEETQKKGFKKKNSQRGGKSSQSQIIKVSPSKNKTNKQQNKKSRRITSLNINHNNENNSTMLNNNKNNEKNINAKLNND
eukprot:UN22780